MNGKESLPKIILVGEPSVGKTSIVNRLIYDTFSDERKTTSGYDVGILKHNGRKYMIWDTAGQSNYSTITSTHYRDADLILLVYDLNDTDSMKKMEPWIRRIYELCDLDTSIVIIGNKNDLGHKGTIVKINNNILDVIYVSAKENIGFDSLKSYIEKIFNKKRNVEKNIVLKKSNKQNQHCCF